MLFIKHTRPDGKPLTTRTLECNLAVTLNSLTAKGNTVVEIWGETYQSVNGRTTKTKKLVASLTQPQTTVEQKSLNNLVVFNKQQQVSIPTTVGLY